MGRLEGDSSGEGRKFRAVSATAARERSAKTCMVFMAIWESPRRGENRNLPVCAGNVPVARCVTRVRSLVVKPPLAILQRGSSVLQRGLFPKRMPGKPRLAEPVQHRRSQSKISA